MLKEIKAFSATTLGVLLFIVCGNLAAFDRPESARLHKAESDIRVLEAVINVFITDIGRCPTTEEGLAVLAKPTTELLDSGKYKDGGYLERLPHDPWGNEYQYQCPGTHNIKTFDVWTFGSNSQAGGSDTAEGFGNWPGSFGKLQAKQHLYELLYVVSYLALIGFVVGLPLYIAGIAIKIRRGSPLPAAFLGFHLGAQIYLSVLAPFVFILITAFFYPSP